MKVKNQLLLLAFILLAFLSSGCSKRTVEEIPEKKELSIKEGKDQEIVLQILQFYETLHLGDYVCTLTSESNCIDIFYGDGESKIWVESCIPGIGYQVVVETTGFVCDSEIEVSIDDQILRYTYVKEYSNCSTDNHVLKSATNSIISNYGVKSNQILIVNEGVTYLFDQIEN